MLSAESIKSAFKKRRLFFIPLAVLCGLLVLYFGINAVLSSFNLQFTNYVKYAVFAGCVISIVIMFLYGIAFFFKGTRISRHYVLYWLGCILTFCLLCAFLFYMFVGAAFFFQPIHVVEKDGEKYIANVTIALSTRYVDYYDYKNIFVSGKVCRIQEDYADGSDDPVAVNDEVLRADYYNKDGTLNHSYENPYKDKYRY